MITCSFFCCSLTEDAASLASACLQHSVCSGALLVINIYILHTCTLAFYTYADKKDVETCYISADIRSRYTELCLTVNLRNAAVDNASDRDVCSCSDSTKQRMLVFLFFLVEAALTIIDS